MKFEVDSQTAKDLELFDKRKDERSIFSLFNHTLTIGGYNKLKETFASPLSDIKRLENRVQAIIYFENSSVPFEIDKVWFDLIDYYLIQDKKPTKLSIVDIVRKSVDRKVRPSNKTYIIQRGILCLVKTINELYEFANKIDAETVPEYIANYKHTITNTIESTNLRFALLKRNKKRIGFIWIGKFDFYFRYSDYESIIKLLDIVYEIDMFGSVAIAKRKLGLSYPKYNSTQVDINIKGLFHPFIKNPVSNDLKINHQKNLCFLTGPNMAGKSTYLKSFGISVYLSHIGFPVPAQSMETFVFCGLYSSINIADNVSKGYSHYYSEVLRIKFIAEQISQRKNVIVIFDELFRGTNVKDAYEASLAVISAFAKVSKSLFAISTHLIEVADELKAFSCIDFKYFEIAIENDIPRYTYKLKEGVTNERLGLYILKKEKVLETIAESGNQP